MRKHYHFIKEFIRSPGSVGSLVPSSSYLASAICKELTKERKAPLVIELGPGTGVMTEHIFRSIPDSRSYVGFEVSDKFRAMLKEHFGDITLIGGDTNSLKEHIDTYRNKADFIISTLPFTTMPRKSVQTVLESCWHYLQPGGEFRMFLYLHTMHLPKNRRILSDAKMMFAEKGREFVVRNIPPAMVFNFVKAESACM